VGSEMCIRVRPHDAAAAARELDAAGWRLAGGVRRKDGQALTLLYAVDAEDPLEPPLAVLADAQLAKLGVRTTIHVGERKWTIPFVTGYTGVPPGAAMSTPLWKLNWPGPSRLIGGWSKNTVRGSPKFARIGCAS